MEKLIGYAVIGVVIWTVWSSVSTPAPTIAGKVPIPEKPTAFHWKWKEDSDAAAQVELENRSTHESLGGYAVGVDGLLNQSPNQADHGVVVATYQPSLYLGKWNVDAGGFIAAANIPDKHAAQVGIRYSPCRLAFGTLAPDVLATEDAVGLGFSLYAPERSVGSVWSRFGVEAGYMVPWGGGRPGLVLGIGTSITH